MIQFDNIFQMGWNHQLAMGFTITSIESIGPGNQSLAQARKQRAKERFCWNVLGVGTVWGIHWMCKNWDRLERYAASWRHREMMWFCETYDVVLRSKLFLIQGKDFNWTYLTTWNFEKPKLSTVFGCFFGPSYPNTSLFLWEKEGSYYWWKKSCTTWDV